MDILQIILWLIAFGLFVVASSAVQNGIYIITRGETYTRPDGQEQDRDDMIAYWFYKLIMKERLPPEKVFYSGEDLSDLIARAKKTIPIPAEARIGFNTVFYNATEEELSRIFQHPTVKDYFGKQDIQMEYNTAHPENGGKGFVMFYTEQKRYVLSKYLRKPLAECLKCFPSVWGSVIYWPTVLYVFHGFHHMQAVVWIPYLLACSYVNTLLFYRAK